MLRQHNAPLFLTECAGSRPTRISQFFKSTIYYGNKIDGLKISEIRYSLAVGQ